MGVILCDLGHFSLVFDTVDEYCMQKFLSNKIVDGQNVIRVSDSQPISEEMLVAQG